ncbi:YihY/virulence factor BrkB family protein [Salinisphaera hydrothermalis]|uniref:Ribonuclease BN n=1 Tax=Salinisphaera hydrothermalis (strain C41B8) TaxID=1304275 RepID=A0A084IKV4_SALHC|nr:YihY/virulence factor BrkB family protein [Salinisphaera hydrothermalis]KEZ77338.1 ribonuclease BN [Salinisphaera hydrothermalis C41B8]
MPSQGESRGTGSSRREWPSDIPAVGWAAILRGVARGVGRHQVSIDAAAISFLALFAIFSAVSAFVAFYGLLADPAFVVQQMKSLSGFVPADVVISMINQMHNVATRAAPTLWGAGVFSLVVAVWCAQQGVGALMVSLNAAYRQSIAVGGWRHLFRSLALALAVITGLVVVSMLAIGFPIAAQVYWGDLWLSECARAGGMILGGLMLFFGLAALYRFVPDRPSPRWRWVRVGAGLVVAFWAIASILFSVFLAYSDSYTAMYGSLSGVVLLLTLTYVTVMTVLVGAEFNAQLEAYCDVPPET